MTERARYIANLFKKSLSESLSAAELQELEAWAGESTGNREFADSMLRAERVAADVRSFYLYDKGGIASKIEHEIAGLDLDLNESETTSTMAGRLYFLKNRWLRWAGAAAVLVILGIGAYLYTLNISRRSPNTHWAATQADVSAPSALRATITLSNGKTLALDSVQSGMLAREGNIEIEKTADGKIVYHGLADGEMLYNTIDVPRGSRVASIVLADGSTVLLNTASSLTYPVAFTGNERKVSVTGEAYFEVAKNKHSKFIVESNGISTEVLGTHFNVNTYNDESSKAITLLEGSIRVNKSGKAIVLKPAQQAIIENDNITLQTGIDTSTVMAWKNGVFQFNKTPLTVALRQIARWYDLTIVYNSRPNIFLGGSMGRDLSLRQVLKILSGMGVKYNLKGKVLEIN